MPSHPERVRTASLPEGYQFGDASRPMWWLGNRMWQETSDPVFNYRTIRAHEGAILITADNRDQHAVAVAESFVKNNPTANRPPVLFRLGVDTCPTCGTKGQYDCPDCGVFTTGRDLGDER